MLVRNGRGFSHLNNTNWTLLFLLQAQLNFLHLENNAEDDMSAKTPPEQRQQSAPAAV